MNAYRPSVEVQRAQLEKAKEQFRQEGYAAEINLEVLSVQTALDDEAVERQIKNTENSRDNAYASARKCDELLAKLPKEKKAKSEPVNPAERNKR